MEPLKLFLEVLRVSCLITSFVITMMLFVEYVNVSTRGATVKWLSKGGIAPTFLITLIATTPGCLGGFTAVSLFLHGAISRGILVGSMIAASGDEAFVMLAMMPKLAILIFLFLLFYGILVGRVTDYIFRKKCYLQKECKDGLTIHLEEKESIRRIDFKKWSIIRVLFLILFVSVFILVILGYLGEDEWNWERFALIATSITGFVIITLASDHFIEEHFLSHIIKKHALRLFLWTTFALFLIELFKIKGEAISGIIKSNEVIAIFIASFIGILPESGPHLIFVAGFLSGVMPLSTLIASSVVQDGHSMLPLLAESKVEFLKVKAINFVAGILAGLFFMFLFKL